jgi:hypothetical protein
LTKSASRLEWAFLPVLDRHEFAPAVLHKELTRNPDFFAEIVALIYPADDEDMVEPSDQERARAERGHDLLQSWGILPGAGDNGEIDASALRTWVQNARAAIRDNRRLIPGEREIGRLLSHAPGGR